MNNRSNKSDDPPGSALVGLVIFGLAVVGVLSVIGACSALAAKGDFIGGGMLAIAAALSCGLLLNALSRS